MDQYRIFNIWFCTVLCQSMLYTMQRDYVDLIHIEDTY